MAAASPPIDLMLIDMSAICYASAHQPGLARFEHDGQPTGVIMGAINSVARLVGAHPAALPLVLWDGRAQWRYDLWPSYKSGRDDRPEKVHARALVHAQAPHVRALLTDLGIPQARHPDAEADDLAGYVVVGLASKGIRIRMISPDTDWWQAIGDGVDWYSPITDRMVDLNVLCSSNVGKDAPADGWRSPVEYLQAKILSGDDSDEIPGIQGVGKVTAAKILRSTPGGLDDLIAGQVPGRGVVVERLRTEEARDILSRNSILMNWSAGQVPRPEDLAAWAFAPQIGLAQSSALDFGLKALAARLPSVFGSVDHSANPLLVSAVEAIEWTPWVDFDDCFCHAPQIPSSAAPRARG